MREVNRDVSCDYIECELKPRPTEWRKVNLHSHLLPTKSQPKSALFKLNIS